MADTSPYSNRELDAKFASLSSKMDEKEDMDAERFEAQNKILADIKEQTTKTNGSVAKVTAKQSWLSGFSYAMGAFIVAIMVPALGYLVVIVINSRAQIAALSALVHILSK